MLRSTLIALFLYTMPILAWGQLEIDSLRTQYINTTDDSLKVVLGLELLKLDTTSKKSSFLEVKRTAENQSNSYLIGLANQATAGHLEDQFEYDSAFYYYSLAFDNYEA